MELDKSMIGLAAKPYTFTVENFHVRQFAAAIGDRNPLYTDEKYAAQSPYNGTIVPPTFPVAMNSGNSELPIELDQRRMLHGEQEFLYYKPIRIGDRIHCQMKVSDIYERQGSSGAMQFLVLDTEMKNADGEVVCINRMNIIYRALKGTGESK